MALPDTFDRAGVVLGSALLVSLPVSSLVAVLAPDLYTLATLPAIALWFGPGAVVGTLVAFERLPATYREVWLFSVLAWLVTFGLWQAFGGTIPPDQAFVGLAAWIAAVVFAALVTWRREWLLGAVATDPEES